MPSCGGEETGWTQDSPHTHSSRALGLKTRVGRNEEQPLRDYQHFILTCIPVKKYDKEYLIHCLVDGTGHFGLLTYHTNLQYTR